MKSTLILLVIFSLAVAQTQRYIIAYDEPAWKKLNLNSLPAKPFRVLNNLAMLIADLDADQVKAFEAMPGVTIAQDTPVHTSSSSESVPKYWGLDRIDQHQLPLNQEYYYNYDGTGVDAWVIDTGVEVNHPEFYNGRAIWEVNYAGDGQDTDCNGHGTHVSSIIGGVNVGVAKNVIIHAVKVLDCSGSGYTSGVISGIDYVISKKSSTGGKFVINMSLGGPKNSMLNQAVATATGNPYGITVVVAAGNSGANACNYSPSGAPTAITVAATDTTDTAPSWTNFGSCVTLSAPGVNITAAWIPDTYAALSGTSMASPHVAGAAVLVLQSGAASLPADVKNYLVTTGTKNVIKSLKGKTPNILLYTLGNT